MASLTDEQRTELTRSGVLKDLVGKSWSDPAVQKAVDDYYKGKNTLAGSSGGGSKGVKPTTGLGTGATPAPTPSPAPDPKVAMIANYSKMYADAKAKGDWMSMEYANKMANQLRGLGAVVTATTDINAIKNNSAFNNVQVPQNTGAASAQPEAPTAATQPATEAFEPQIDRLGNVLMDNGSGRWVAVNPKAVDKYLAQGWTYWGSGETSNAIPVLSSSAGTEANIYDLINGQNTAQAGSMAQLNSIINSLGSLTSSNNYQTILEKILAQNMPMYNSGKTEIQQQFQENAGNINADAERRGLFNSGVAAELQQKNDAAQVAELAKLLANVKSLSANQAQDAVGQQLQAAGLQGDMVTQGMQLSQSGIQNALNALLGLGDLGVAQQNANTNQQNANTNQQNADTNATSVSNQYNLGLLQLGVDQQRLDESARQFDARLALDRDLRNDDLKQFAQTMSLNWAQLNAQAKAQAADALYRARALDLDTRKFNSEQELIKAQQNQERLQVSFGAYDYLDKMFAQGATKEDLIAAIQPYKDLDAGLHSDLIDTVNRHFTTTTATQSSSGYNYTPPQNTGNIYSGFIR